MRLRPAETPYSPWARVIRSIDSLTPVLRQAGNHGFSASPGIGAIAFHLAEERIDADEDKRSEMRAKARSEVYRGRRGVRKKRVAFF